MPRDVDTIYFKELNNESTGIKYRVEVVPAYPKAGAKDTSFVYEELPDGVIVQAADLQAAADKIPFGIIDAPSITVNMELQNAPANFRTVVMNPATKESEFSGDANFDNWYATKISTVWILKRKVGTGDWTTRGIYVQRIAPGIKITEYLSDDNVTIVKQFEAEILSVGAYLLQNVSVEYVSDQIRADSGLTTVQKSFVLDVVKKFDDHGDQTLLSVWSVTMNLEALRGSVAVLKFWKLSDLFTKANTITQQLFRVLVRDNTATVSLLRMPHENVTFYKQYNGGVASASGLYFVGEYRMGYHDERTGVTIANALTGGLLVESEIRISTGLSTLPYIRLSNEETLRDYANLFDFYKDVAENFYSKCTWRVTDGAVSYRFDLPFDAVSSDTKEVMARPLIVSSDKRVPVEKQFSYNALRGVEVNIDGSHKSEAGDDKFLVDNEAMTASESKLEVKAIFHNVPDVPTDAETFLDFYPIDVVSGRDFVGNVNLQKKPVCSKLVYMETVAGSTATDASISFAPVSNTVDPPVLYVGGAIPVRVANTVTLRGVDYETDDQDEWEPGFELNGFSYWFGALLFIGRTACLPIAICKQGLADFGNEAQTSAETMVETRLFPASLNNIGDVYEWSSYDDDLDARLQLDKAVIISITERVTDTYATIVWFIPGQ